MRLPSVPWSSFPQKMFTVKWLMVYAFAMWKVSCVIALAFGLLVLKECNPWQRRRAALWNAISKSDVGTVKRLTDSSMNLNYNYNWQFRWLGSPLAFAFWRANRSIIDILIARGASLSPESPGNEAMLSCAVHSGDYQLIDLALSAGHDIHFKPRHRSRPLATAIHHNAIPMARFLVSRGAGKDDITPGDGAWHKMHGETILFVRDLGIEVPPEVLTAVENGNWDRPATIKNP
jgi:hypothetical protein